MFQLIVVHPQPPGEYTALVPGIPELSARASTREEAIRLVHLSLLRWLQAGQLVPVELPAPPSNPLVQFAGRANPDDPLEQEYLKELARARQEDLERTLQEYDRECSNSSATPTT
jgi:hypothetical protein